MSLQQFLLALRARARLFIFILIGIVAAATAITLILPKSYEATASILVEAPGSRPLGYNQTQADILTSQRVLLKVVQDLKLANDPGFREAFAKNEGGETYETWLSGMLLKQLKVDTSQSSVIQILFRWTDPQFAANAANAFARAYVQASDEIRATPSKEANSWFDEQLTQLRKSADEAQGRLEDYRRRQGIVATDERVDIENARLQDLSRDLMMINNQGNDLALKDQQARSANPETLPEVMNNGYIQGLRSDVARSEARLQQMRGEFGANHPMFQQAAAENAMLKERLQSEMKRFIGGFSSTVRHNRQREAEIRVQLETQRQKVLGMRHARDQVETLTREAQAARQNYENTWQRALSNRIESKTRQPNVAVLNEALEPTEPHRPKLALNIALSVIVGLMLAAGMVYFMESVDRRVRSKSEFEAYLPVPVLGEIGKWRPEGGLLGGPAGPGRALPNPAG